MIVFVPPDVPVNAANAVTVFNAVISFAELIVALAFITNAVEEFPR